MRVRYVQNFQPKLGPDVVIENTTAVPRVGDQVKLYDKILVAYFVTWNVQADRGTPDVDIIVGYR